MGFWAGGGGFLTGKIAEIARVKMQ